VHAPRLLLLDEPTTGLDAESVEGLRLVVRAEAERGAIVVVITHDEGFAEAAGDDRVVLDRGRVKEVAAREGRGAPPPPPFPAPATPSV
jgi:ABC-type multidrug transport system ATPase subunit